MILVLCFHIVKCTSFLSPPILSWGQKIAKMKQSKLPPRRDPIITRSRIKEMSTSGTSPHEENAQESSFEGASGRNDAYDATTGCRKRTELLWS